MKRQRFMLLLTLIACIAASALLLADAFVRDQALMLAGFGALAVSAAAAILLLPARLSDANDPWATVSWGKFFVAIVYASFAVACLVAVAHTADAARVAHALRVAL
jgi:hypothetical protein